MEVEAQHVLVARGGGAVAEEEEAKGKGKESYNDALRRFQAGLGAASDPRPSPQHPERHRSPALALHSTLDPTSTPTQPVAPHADSASTRQPLSPPRPHVRHDAFAPVSGE